MPWPRGSALHREHRRYSCRRRSPRPSRPLPRSYEILPRHRRPGKRPRGQLVPPGTEERTLPCVGQRRRRHGRRKATLRGLRRSRGSHHAEGAVRVPGPEVHSPFGICRCANEAAACSTLCGPPGRFLTRFIWGRVLAAAFFCSGSFATVDASGSISESASTSGSFTLSSGVPSSEASARSAMLFLSIDVAWWILSSVVSASASPAGIPWSVGLSSLESRCPGFGGGILDWGLPC